MNVDTRPLIFEIAGSGRGFGHFEFPSGVEMDRGAAAVVPRAIEILPRAAEILPRAA